MQFHCWDVPLVRKQWSILIYVQNISMTSCDTYGQDPLPHLRLISQDWFKSWICQELSIWQVRVIPSDLKHSVLDSSNNGDRVVTYREMILLKMLELMNRWMKSS
jgi:hypothetical protein